MGARDQVGIGLSYRPASLCSLATQFPDSVPEIDSSLSSGPKVSDPVYNWSDLCMLHSDIILTLASVGVDLQRFALLAFSRYTFVSGS